LKTFLQSFKPKREGEDDYSALVATFLRSVMSRKSKGEGKGKASRGDDRDDGDPLNSFRRRYPMDDRAYKLMEEADPKVRTTVINDFRPRREGEADYSALVMAFVRAVQQRNGMGQQDSRDRRDTDRQDKDGDGPRNEETKEGDDRKSRNRSKSKSKSRSKSRSNSASQD